MDVKPTNNLSKVSPYKYLNKPHFDNPVKAVYTLRRSIQIGGKLVQWHRVMCKQPYRQESLYLNVQDLKPSFK